ncbi:MAG: prolyl oligopeptidase family serine peptidase [Clostridia bacterium]|nr:prolyl oligopeptidase family serine peptidase [Clostridia bacterium]
MYLKSKLLKAASICMYVFTALWFLFAACFFALGNYWYIGFALFALISLYDGFVITSVREKMTGVTLEKKEWIKLLVCWILSIVCPPAFVLNGIAFFRDKEDEPQEVTVKPAEEKKCEKPNGKKRFYKAKSFITMCVAFGMIFIASFFAMCFETSGFKVKVTDFTLTGEMTKYYNEGKIDGKAYVLDDDDVSYSVTMYVPDTATEANPAATVFVFPGFTRTKATMAQYAMELSRRGAVVFTMDPTGQGGTTINSYASDEQNRGQNGIEHLVQYVYNNTDDFKFCDKNRFGAMGHSQGGGNVAALAADFAGDSFYDSVIKSVYISGYIKYSSINNYQNFKCNAGLAYGYYDEGAYRYQTDAESFEVAAQRFINENGDESDFIPYSEIEIDKGYGDMANGTYRVVHREDINHCFEMYDPVSIKNTINFFNETLDISDMGGGSQLWFGKEFFNGIALAAAFTFIIAACAVLMGTPVFKSLKEKPVEKISDDEIREITEEEAEEELLGRTVNATADAGMETVAKGTHKSLAEGIVSEHKTVAHKVIFWSCIILTAIIACLDYIPLANLSIEIFPTSNVASVYTYTFPARMINAILLWALINGAIGLVIFFGTTLIENLYEYIRFKVKGIEPAYDWDKFKAIKISGNGWKGTLLNVGKAIFLPLVMFGAFYFLVQLNYWMFHQDFRFTLISASPLNARMFVTALEYWPIIFVFYISNSIRVNCSIGREGWKEWKVILVSALANSVGLIFILIINYFCYFTTGSPYYTYWGNGNEVWLYINMVFALVVMMFILPIFNRLLYRITGNVWSGAIVCCMIFIMMTISASVSYIPM